MAAAPPGAVLFEVVGGGASGGIMVRQGKETTSPEAPKRLAKGAWVVQLEADGERMRFWKVFGAGPRQGWVSMKFKGKDLLERRQGPPPRPPLPPWPEETEAVTLGYWANRSLAAPSRMALHYAGVRFDNRLYELVPDEEEEGQWDGKAWHEDAKPHLFERNGLINLPFVIFDGHVVTQSGAVLLSIGRRCGLCGDTEDQIRSNEMVLMEGLDLRGIIGGIAYTKPEQAFVENAGRLFAEAIPRACAKLERYLSQRGSDFFSGPKPLVADFLVWEALDQLRILVKFLWPMLEFWSSPKGQLLHLKAFHRRMRRLPALEGYFSSERGYLLPCQNKPAFFNVRVTDMPGALEVEGDDGEGATPAAPAEAPAEETKPSLPPWPAETKPITLGCWKTRAFAAPARMLLSYAGADYEDRRYELQPGEEEGSWSNHEWSEHALPHLFERNGLANLPYAIIDGKVISQTLAILLALGRKFSLSGENEDQVRSNEMVLMQAFDMQQEFGAVAWTPEEWFADAANSFFEGSVPTGLTKLLKYLEQRGTDFFSGPRPLSGDFVLWEVLDQIEEMARFVKRFPPLNSYPLVRKYHKRFRQLPEMQKYFASDAYRLPCQNKAAFFKVVSTR